MHNSSDMLRLETILLKIEYIEHICQDGIVLALDDMREKDQLYLCI